MNNFFTGGAGSKKINGVITKETKKWRSSFFFEDPKLILLGGSEKLFLNVFWRLNFFWRSLIFLWAGLNSLFSGIFLKGGLKKFRIREALNVLTDADSNHHC